VIESAEEFVALRTSERPTEYHRAAHEEAPEHVWRDVIARYPDFRRWVAHNKTVPVAILETLARDSDPTVRWAVAQKRKAPETLLEQLARDSDASVRHCVACNAKTPRHLREALAQDEEEFVREAARARLGE
jgi:hypothetical protein